MGMGEAVIAYLMAFGRDFPHIVGVLLQPVTGEEKVVFTPWRRSTSSSRSVRSVPTSPKEMATFCRAHPPGRWVLDGRGVPDCLHRLTADKLQQTDKGS